MTPVSAVLDLTAGSRSTRRDLLTGRAVGDAVADRLAEAATTPERSFEAGSTVRLAMRAMACEFVVALAGGKRRETPHASDALDLVHHLERVMTVYRDESELSAVNRAAADGEVPLSDDLAPVVAAALELAELTDGAFDPTAGPLIRLWREAKASRRLPDEDVLAETLGACGYRKVSLDGDGSGFADVRSIATHPGADSPGSPESGMSVRYDRPGVSLDLGAIGKGYAIDRAVGYLEECGVGDFLVHGGLSSVAARGSSGENDGWPVGLGDPLRPNRRFATLMLKNAAMATSGANNQFFRIGAERYGHIVDPRGGRPASGLLSVTAVAPSATAADALSTAFYVMGVEKSVALCDTYMGIGCILVPPPGRSGRLSPVVRGIDPAHLTLASGTPGRET